MSIYVKNHLKHNQALLNLLLGKNVKHDLDLVSRNVNWNKKDTVIISHEGKEIAVKKVASGRNRNRKIDSSIDLQSYIDMAKASNQETIENAGNKIDYRTMPYVDVARAFRAALTEKYSKLATEAKTHSDPEAYIREKYFCKGSEYYEADLSDIERQIAYRYEKDMYQTGKINGVSFQDSLFRGIEVYGDVVDSDEAQFKGEVVNAQIPNILQQAGINADAIPKSCEFTVNPYTYEISVEGVGQDLKASMEKALNVGENGKYLFYYLYNYASPQGASDVRMKYKAYQEVYSFTGLRLDELVEKDGAYYTEDGQNVLDLANVGIDQSKDIPYSHKAAMKTWIHDLISNLSKLGWSNVPDISLSLQYGEEYTTSDDGRWYHVM